VEKRSGMGGGGNNLLGPHGRGLVIAGSLGIYLSVGSRLKYGAYAQKNGEVVHAREGTKNALKERAS